MYVHPSVPSAMLFGLFSNDSENCFWVQMILMDQKFIWALCFDTPGC